MKVNLPLLLFALLFFLSSCAIKDKSHTYIAETVAVSLGTGTILPGVNVTTTYKRTKVESVACLRDYLKELEARIDHLAQVEATSTVTREKTASRKERELLEKALKDCQEWERNVILPADPVVDKVTAKN